MLIDGNLTLVYKGWARGDTSTAEHLISGGPGTGTDGAGPASDTGTIGGALATDPANVNELLDVGEDRQLGRGKTPYLVISANRNGGGDVDTENYVFILSTGDAPDSDGLITNAVKIGEVQMPGNVEAGASRWIALPDNTEQYLQLTYTANTGADEDLQFEAFVSTELPTTTQITRAPYVSYNSYSANTSADGYGKGT